MTDKSQLDQPSVLPSPAAEKAKYHDRVLAATGIEKSYRHHPGPRAPQ